MKRSILLVFIFIFLKNMQAQINEQPSSDSVFQKHIDFIFQEMIDMKNDISEEANEKRNRDAEELYNYYREHLDESTGHTALFTAYFLWSGNKNYDLIKNKFENENLNREEMWVIPFEQYRRAFWKQDDNNGLLKQMEMLTKKVNNPNCLTVLYTNLGEWNYYKPDLSASKKWFLKLKEIKSFASEKHLSKTNTFLYEIDSLQINMAAPEFLATDLNGDKIKLSDLKGKVVLLDFWATWCKPCIAGLPAVKELKNKYSDRNDFQIVGISLDTDLEKWENYVAAENLDWINICEGEKRDGDIVRLFNAMGIPKYYVIDKDGKIKFNAMMARDGKDYKEIIEALLN